MHFCTQKKTVIASRWFGFGDGVFVGKLSLHFQIGPAIYCVKLVLSEWY